MPASPTFESTPLIHCPSRDPIPYPVAYPTTWYALISTPAFRACSNCYHSSILPAGLSKLFYPIVESIAGPDRFCNYNTPRVRSLVARVSLGDDGAVKALEAHAAHRVTVSDCRLGRAVAPKENFGWHRLRGGMDACHACYSDFLSASNFATEIPAETVQQPPTQLALCDVGNAFARRMATEAGDYDEFLEALSRRTRTPHCAGTGLVSAGSRAWFRPRDPRARGLAVCEECFLDAAGGTQYETMFEEARFVKKALACGFGTYPALAVNFGLMMEFREPKLFLRAVDAVLSNPPCSATGILPGTPYYTLPSVQNFAICGPCFASLVAPIRVLDAHLVKGAVALPEGTICAINAANPRAEQYIKKISESAEKGEPSIFLSSVSYLSNSLPCPRSNPTDGEHKWTGNGEFSACQDCARDVVLQSPLAVFMTYREATVPGPRKCDFYSPRVREFWGQASRARDLRAALSDFGVIMRHREAVWRKMVKTREDVEAGVVEPRDVEALEARLSELEALWAEVE
ncbi:hypothetical protein VUR80DRAFT_1657 [Thermomyces stellatus]